MLFSAALLALPVLAQSAYAATCTRQYTVQAGDICDSISAAQNVSTYQLAAINTGIIDSTCDNLQVGSTLCLGYAGEDCTTTYQVVAGDSCDALAAAHGLNTTILYLNNPQINSECTNIYVGEVLCVAGTVQAPAQPSTAIHGDTIPATASPANPAATATPTPTSASHSSTKSSSATPTATPSAAAEDDDDDDLPYCDEL
ncbi:hypothetical protein H0H92_002858 [Tricholoma furcatifolium]|nr:hypothetical protein H0H92_002858 [Tricholoma furcatifolium]